jgi:hypothetical protein
MEVEALSGRPLTYAPLSELRRLKWRRRWRCALLVLLCAAVLGGAIAFLWVQGPNLLLQHRCSRFVDRADRVVYDSGANRGAIDVLIAADGRYVRVRALLPPTDSPGVLFTHKDWYELIHAVESERSITSKDIRAPLFLHERTSTGAAGVSRRRGSRRLVAVELCDGWTSVTADVVKLYVFEPASVSWPPKLLWSAQRSLGTLQWGGFSRKGLQILAGQPDTNDSARFVIPFVLGGKAGAIDGTLEGDDHISLRIRDEQEIWRYWMHERSDAWEEAQRTPSSTSIVN